MDRRAIDEQVERLLSSPTFANKGQVRKLLNVLYQNMDSEATLKPDDVIKELWPTEIKTKRSADVATEVNRLRHALKSYYEQEGTENHRNHPFHLPNRAATAGESAHKTRWIAAKIREGAESSGAAETLDRDLVHPGKKRKIAAAAAVLAVLGISAIPGPEPPPRILSLSSGAWTVRGCGFSTLRGRSCGARIFPMASAPTGTTTRRCGAHTYGLQILRVKVIPAFFFLIHVLELP